MSNWPKGVDQCKACGCSADRRRHGSRGYCYRCHYYIKRRDAAAKWTFAQPQTFRESVHASYMRQLTQLQFDAFKTGYMAGIRRALTGLQVRERMREGELEALNLEYKFGEMLQLLKPNAPYPPNASHLARHFTKAQMAIIFRLLDDILEKVEKNSDMRAYRSAFDKSHIAIQ